MKPSIGRIVHYTLSERDAEGIRFLTDRAASVNRGAVAPVGDDAWAGETYPAVIVSVSGHVGWFAEKISDGDPDFNARWPYRAVLQLPGMVVLTSGHWFATEADCLDFIRTDILGKGLLPERR